MVQRIFRGMRARACIRPVAAEARCGSYGLFCTLAGKKQAAGSCGGKRCATARWQRDVRCLRRSGAAARSRNSLHWRCQLNNLSDASASDISCCCEPITREALRCEGLGGRAVVQLRFQQY